MLIPENFWIYFPSRLGMKLACLAPLSQLLIRLGDPESIPLRGSHLKNEPIWHQRLGCRGGAIGFGCSTSYYSGTCVYVSEYTVRKVDRTAPTDRIEDL